MTPDTAERLDRIRVRAAAHHEAIESRTWLKPRDLAARWCISLSTVYAIPRDELPFKGFGSGTKRSRRYHPDAVAAFEADGGAPAPDSHV